MPARSFFWAQSINLGAAMVFGMRCRIVSCLGTEETLPFALWGGNGAKQALHTYFRNPLKKVTPLTSSY